MLLHKCSSKKSDEFGKQIPCDGYYDHLKHLHLGCNEPCRFTMGKLGEGAPPITEEFNKKVEAYIFELAQTVDKSTGEYSDWKEFIQVGLPVVPEKAIRNLRPLYAGECINYK